MKFSGLICIVFLCAIVIAQAQPPVDWIRTYDAGGSDGFLDIYLMPDGGYALCGYTYDPQGDVRLSRDMWIARIEENGNLTWSQTYGLADSYDALYSIIETDQGNFLAGGRLGDQFSAILVNEEGEEIWRQTYGGGECNAVIELKSGEFLLGGSWSGSRGAAVLIDGDGDALWDESYGQADSDRFKTMRETQGGVILGGYSYFRNQRPIYRVWVLKIDFNGEQLWSNHIAPQNDQMCRSMVSIPNAGFALAGKFWEGDGSPSEDFALITINDRGNMEWFRRYDIQGQTREDRATCIARLSQDGFAIVGWERPGRMMSSPIVLRVRSNGVERWHRVYDFEDNEEIAGTGHNFSSVLETEDNSIIAAGSVVLVDGNQGRNGLLMKLETDILEPQFISWTPHDTLLTVLIGDTIDFSVEVHDAQDDEISYLWIMGEDTLSEDTTVTVIFDELGEYEVQCQVSDGEFIAAITWHVSVVEWFIDGFTPDSLDIIIRRGSNIDFSLEIAAIEDIELNYLWTLTDRNRRREEVSEADSVTVRFDLAGDFQLGGFVWRGEESDEVNWDIYVRSVVWYWWPREDSLTVPVGYELLFAITPFNPDSDSLEYLWTLDGDTMDVAQEIEILFEETGLYEVVAFVHDGCEADTIYWEVTVVPLVSIIESDIGLLPTEPVLYPPAPNPFNSITNITIAIPYNDFVNLIIYDATGRKVAGLLEGFVSPGFITTTWDAGNLSTGLYFVMLATKSVRKTVKIVYIR